MFFGIIPDESAMSRKFRRDFHVIINMSDLRCGKCFIQTANCLLFLPISALWKTHMAYRKKYKALILKQVPCILKYMACIFRLSKYLNNSILQKSFGKP